MSDVEARIAAIRARVDEVTRARARQEAERDAAQAALDKVMEELRTEFGVNSLEEAQAMLKRMDEELNEAIEEVRVLVEVSSE